MADGPHNRAEPQTLRLTTRINHPRPISRNLDLPWHSLPTSTQPKMSTDTAHAPASGSLLAKLLADDSTFHPAAPRTIEETGLSAASIDALILKYLMLVGS